MGLHGDIHPTSARRLTLHVLTQIADVDGHGRMAAIREVVSVEQVPDHSSHPMVPPEPAGRLGLL